MFVLVSAELRVHCDYRACLISGTVNSITILHIDNSSETPVPSRQNLCLFVKKKNIYIYIYTGYKQKNGAVSKVNKKFISHLTRAQRTTSAAATVQVSQALVAVRFSCLLRGRLASFQDGVAARKGFMCAPFWGVQICDYSARFRKGAPAWCVFSKPCTKLTLHCNHRSGHLKTEHTESLFLLRRHLGNWPRGPAVSIRSELLAAHEKLGQLLLLTVYVVPL